MKKHGHQKIPKYKIVVGDGPACPRCEHPTEIREHTFLTEKHLAQPFYYSRWFYCTNDRCRPTLIMRDEFKVYPENRELWA